MRAASLSQAPQTQVPESRKSSSFSAFYSVMAGLSALLLGGIYVFVHFVAKNW